MTKGNRSFLGVFLFLCALIAGGVAGFIVRGVYDRLTMLEGLVHVVNATGSPQGMEVVFPSGQREPMPLAAGAAATFRAVDTGEGGIGVNIDGRAAEEVGYVTSRNGMMVLTVGEEKVSFSQVSASDMK